VTAINGLASLSFVMPWQHIVWCFWSVLMGAFFAQWQTAGAPQPVHPSVRVRHLMNAAAGSLPIRIVKDPRDNALYYLKQSGSIYRITVNPGTNTSTGARVYGTEHHTISAAAGMAIGPDGTIYVVGNTSTNNDNSTFATIMKGVTNTAGGRTWSMLARTQPYPRSRTYFDHVFNGIVASPDRQFVYVNSGSRTDHGEVQSVNGLFPNTREVPLTAKILRLPASAINLVLTNDIAMLRAGGFIFAEGVRNTYDMAFAPNGDLFGTENGPDRDMAEELNWLRAGRHYGFPWRIGGADNPQQFPNYDPSADQLLDPRFAAVQGGYYHNDPTFPPAPPNLTEPVINVGPDADSYRDPADGQVRDASSQGRTLSTFTAHRSPLGLVFDVDGVMANEFRHHGFVLSWTQGDPNGDSVAGPFRDASQDLLDLELTKLGQTNYQARVRRIVGGFSNPIDAEIVDNRIYVIEYGGSLGIWEVTMPRRLTIAGQFVSTGRFELAVTGDIGRRITIQASTNLTMWLDLANVTNTTGTVRFTNLTSLRRRFYRAVQP
jgi:hypothetical protein